MLFGQMHKNVSPTNAMAIDKIAGRARCPHRAACVSGVIYERRGGDTAPYPRRNDFINGAANADERWLARFVESLPDDQFNSFRTARAKGSCSLAEVLYILGKGIAAMNIENKEQQVREPQALEDE